MPVFGVVQGHPIIGIIVCSNLAILIIRLLTAEQDEISLGTIPKPEAEPNSRRKRASTPAQGTTRRSGKRRELSPSQSHVTDFFTSPSKASRSPSPIRPMYELSLKDAKTRRSKSLPSDDDALSSRMQLMLYHHLLSELLSPTFSFSTFWEKVHVNPFEPFSDKFLRDFGLARETDGIIVQGYPDCLDDLADFWRLTVQSYPLQGVSPTLEITYRTQPKRSAAPRLSRMDVLDPLVGDQEERDLQRAIVESLRDINPEEESGAAFDNSRISITTSQSPSPRGTGQLSDTPRIHWYDRSGETVSSQSATAETRPAGMLKTAELRASGLQASTSQPESSNIIGRKTFDFDEVAMQAHVRDVLQWWRGERPPRGVEVEHSRRCL
jgi:exonuclease V